ncbi:hypothetical protein [Pantoea endophytica]
MISERILFVGNTRRNERPYMDPSTRYRCFNIAFSLKELGHVTEVVTMSYFMENIDIAENFKHIVFHRPSLNDERLLRFLYRNKNKKNLIADYDDLIFDVSNIINLPDIEVRDPYLSNVSDYISRNAAANEFFDKFSTSTEPLAEKLKKIKPSSQVSVISNSLSKDYIQLSKKLYSHNVKRKYKLGYFPGTASHNNDFKEISQFIEIYFKENKHGNLFILGPLKLPSSLNKFSHRIDHVKSVIPFSHLPYVKINVETILAPLSYNEFTACKSGLKFFEAMPLGCQVIATAIPDIDRFESNYLHKCFELDDWMKLLELKSVSKDHYHNELENTLSKISAIAVAKIWEERFL